MGVSLDYVVERLSLDGEVVYVRGTGVREIAPFSVQRLEELDHALFHFLDQGSRWRR